MHYSLTAKTKTLFYELITFDITEFLLVHGHIPILSAKKICAECVWIKFENAKKPNRTVYAVVMKLLLCNFSNLRFYR